MVVMWCRACGALLGLRRPFTEWTQDRDGLCPVCTLAQMKPVGGAVVVDEPPAADATTVADKPDDAAG